MPYLNVAEVESALLAASSAPYTGFTQLITLPELTWEGRQCHAIKIAHGTGPSRPGVYFLGGVHAREWGSADILVNFVEQLEQAYLNGTGLTFNTRSFSPADIKTIVDSLDIIVFPQANPDGRDHSMNVDAMWRKNRRVASPNSTACPGVDINRNYDFLWDFPKYFSAAAAIQDSTDPCDYQLYNGPSAFSEPETRNARWIFDNFPGIGFFVDLHSFSEDILYSWGDDQDQSSDPSMTFRNPAFDGKRGVSGDAYSEFIPSADHHLALDLANIFHDGIQALRGKNYTVKSAFDLYPTAGTSDDYAYSRNFVDPSKRKVISYTVEWGTEFQPPYGEMQNIIQEITCGLLAFCLSVRKRLERCAFVVNRSTLGQDEIAARRLKPRGTPGGLPVPDAFRVVVDGFSAAELGITGPSSTLAGTPTTSPAAGLVVVPAGNLSDNGDYGSEIQRFTFFYGLDFPDDSAFAFAAQTELIELDATVATLPAAAQIELIKQPDPFMLHGDPTWLSVDLRVFVVRAGESKFGVPGVSDASDAPRFVQQLLQSVTPAQFDTLSTDEEQSKLYVQPADEGGRPVFNFALAKVHYVGLIGAANVRTFFRLFQAQTTSGAFDFPPGAEYRRAPNNPDGQAIALAGIRGGEYVTVPCFAAPRLDSTSVSMAEQTDPANVQAFTAHADGSEVDRFFGCWLDINQPFKPNGVTPNRVLPVAVPPSPDGPFDVGDANPDFRPLPIQQAVLRNLHQCLIAEIAFDPVAIPLGKDPSNWDKLAQRNLAWSDVGSARALSTFEVRPTRQPLPEGHAADELMIDWGRIPVGSSATIYLPAVKATDVLALADRMYTSHRLARADDHTVRCATGGVTYIPIPPGAGIDYAGLLSVDLAERLPRGQIYDVAVRQVTSASGTRTPPPPPPPGEARHAARKSDRIEWRRALGAFQLTIPVHAKGDLLRREERDLSVLLWIAQAIPRHNRWHPVFARYLEQIGGRVRSFGGDPRLILPSPTGDGHRHHHRHGKGGHEERRRAFTGKIAGLIFDRFGDFEGFLLDTEDGEREFTSREKEIEELAERSWRDRLRITVWTERDAPHRPLSIVVRQPPAPFRS